MILVTDEHGEIKADVPVRIEITGGVFGAEHGKDPNGATMWEGVSQGVFLAKLFVETSPAIVKVEAPGYRDQSVTIYAELRPD